jgi:hypothetical protein
MEVLSVAGVALHERAPLEALPRLNGFEPVPGAPVRYSDRRRYGWDPDVLYQGDFEVSNLSRFAEDMAAQ